VYDRLPYFYSDQFDLGMEFVGRTAGADRVLFREAEEGFVALWVARGRATAGLHGNAWKARKPIERLVADAAEIDLERFRDPEVPLSEVSVGAEAAEAQEGERAAA
jgi:3-phenylpropionate/trans-cinnamate dioxygenase ferredoxin reductase subunit